MRLINQSVEQWGACPSDLIGTMRWLERCGRVCYKSEDKITEDSYLTFVQKMINSGHTSVLEHSNLVLKGDEKKFEFLFGYKKYFRLKGRFVSANLRAWLEYLHCDSVSDIFQRVLAFGEIVDGVPVGLRRVTMKFTTSRAMTHQLVRHRVMSFLQESQRYVRYGATLANPTGIRFIYPLGFLSWKQLSRDIFINSCEGSEDCYLDLMSDGLTPQQARTVLPNATASEIVVTGYYDDWRSLMKLRSAKGADPEMIDLINMVKI